MTTKVTCLMYTARGSPGYPPVIISPCSLVKHSSSGSSDTGISGDANDISRVSIIDFFTPIVLLLVCYVMTDVRGCYCYS